MDRQIVYPGAIPLETDLLNTNKYSMIGLAKLSSAIMGTNTYLHGLQCTASSPASMVVSVAAGEIYSLENIDGTAYSSLNADTTNTILKQGVVLTASQFTLTAPTTAGQSINYLIQVTYSDTDSGATVLPYYNASTPSVAYSGPNNSGTAQNTVRSGVCTVSLKAGVPAATGTQTTPSTDTGYIAAWVITVAQGATTVTAANISQATGAPFIPASGLVDGIQKKLLTHGTDIGTANAYAVNYSPAITSLTDGMELTFKATNTNTGAATFSQNGLTVSPIVTVGGSALTGGEIISGGSVVLKWNAVLSSWSLISSTGSGAQLANLGIGSGTFKGWLLGAPKVFTASGTYTPTAGTKMIRVTVTGGGGSGGGSNGTTTSQLISGAGGGAAGTAIKTLSVAQGTSYPVVVGVGGTSVSGAVGGVIGGNSSFNGSVIGNGGGLAGANSTNAAGGAGGIGTGGDINIRGGNGSDGQSGTFLFAGNGGASYWGGGGRAGAGSGATGQAYGSGGGGAYSNSGLAIPSGAGMSGIVVIEEYS